MKIKTNTLTGPALDWAVALADGNDEGWLHRQLGNPNPETRAIGHYSTDWSQGGPIIDRCIGLRVFHYEHVTGTFTVRHEWGVQFARGASLSRAEFRHESLLVAAMRCFVASRLGDEVEVPEGLS